MKLEYVKNGEKKTVGVDIQYGYIGLEPVDTVVHIYDWETEEVIVSGQASLNPVDNFSKAMGRKIAFGRAVDKLTGKKFHPRNPKVVVERGDVEARIQLWKQFMDTKNGGVRMPSGR